VNEDIIWIGAAPLNEDCAQVGSPDYARKAKIECKAFIEAIRKVCGKEPEGARLTTKPQPYDFGSHYEVAVIFDGNNKEAADYADKVDRPAPATWEEAGMQPPVQHGRGRW
jgi:hypothetical protein